MTILSFLHNGVHHTVGHLSPSVLRCPSNVGRELMISVGYSSHCYTMAFDPRFHSTTDISLYDAGGRPRVFCPVRHGLSAGLRGASLSLPEMIASLPQVKVHQTSAQRNYVFSAPIAFASGLIYEVYFMLQSVSDDPATDLRLTVESAYPVTSPSAIRKRPNTIRFPVLATKIFLGQPVKFAAR